MAKATKAEKTELILRTIGETTTTWAEDVFKPEEKATEKAKHLAIGIDSLSFTQGDKDKLAQLISLATGEKIMLEKDEDLEFSPMAAVVITKTDKHDYETGVVVVSIGDGTFVKPDGKVGGYIKPSRKLLRPATPEEVSKIPKEQLDGLLKEVKIVWA